MLFQVSSASYSYSYSMKWYSYSYSYSIELDNRVRVLPFTRFYTAQAQSIEFSGTARLYVFWMLIQGQSFKLSKVSHRLSLVCVVARAKLEWALARVSSFRLMVLPSPIAMLWRGVLDWLQKPAMVIRGSASKWL